MWWIKDLLFHRKEVKTNFSPYPKYWKTGKFLNKQYVCQKGRLQLGDKVFVHPTSTSQSTEKFKAVIIEKFINWCGGGCFELCTHVEGGHDAVINDYLFSRLELKP